MAELPEKKRPLPEDRAQLPNPGEQHATLVSAHFPVLLRGGWTWRGPERAGRGEKLGAQRAPFPSPKFHVTSLPFPDAPMPSELRGVQSCPRLSMGSGARSRGREVVLAALNSASPAEEPTRLAWLPGKAGVGRSWGSPVGSSTNRTAACTSPGVHFRRDRVFPGALLPPCGSQAMSEELSPHPHPHPPSPPSSRCSRRGIRMGSSSAPSTSLSQITLSPPPAQGPPGSSQSDRGCRLLSAKQGAPLLCDEHPWPHDFGCAPVAGPPGTVSVPSRLGRGRGAESPRGPERSRAREKHLTMSTDKGPEHRGENPKPPDSCLRSFASAAQSPLS